MKANRNSVGVESIHSHVNANLSKNKLQLPSLGQQMYIISTSSKSKQEKKEEIVSDDKDKTIK